MGGKAIPYIRKSLWGNNASHRRGKIIRPKRREFFHPVILRAAKITPTEERSDEHLIHLANLEGSGRDRLKVGRDKKELLRQSLAPSIHCTAPLCLFTASLPLLSGPCLSGSRSRSFLPLWLLSSCLSTPLPVSRRRPAATYGFGICWFYMV